MAKQVKPSVQKTQEITHPKEDIIRSIVRGTYDLQKLRIQMGNRITANFKAKLGFESNGMTEAQLDKQSKQILNILRLDYKLITEGIVEEGDDLLVHKLPTEKKFKPGEVIDTYAELVLFDAYVKMAQNEKENFDNLEKILKTIPIYNEFLEHVDGVGRQMAGVIISEIDITKTTYVASLWKRAGLDVVTIGEYTDEAGTAHTLAGWQLDEYIDSLEHELDGPIMWKGKYPVKLKQVGRSKKDFCLVKRQYTNREGEEKERMSITFNPFLKTKLVGVLADQFLKGSKTYLNGQKSTNTERENIALKLGFVMDKKSPMVLAHQVNDFLRANGYDVEVVRGKYGVIYDQYKARLRMMPAHKEKTDLHTHNMSLRYAVKRFLADLYVAWRTLEGLPVMPEYSEAKLGLTHGQATPEKQMFYQRRGWKPQDPLQDNVGV